MFLTANLKACSFSVENQGPGMLPLVYASVMKHAVVRTVIYTCDGYTVGGLLGVCILIV